MISSLIKAFDDDPRKTKRQTFTYRSKVNTPINNSDTIRSSNCYEYRNENLTLYDVKQHRIAHKHQSLPIPENKSKVGASEKREHKHTRNSRRSDKIKDKNSVDLKNMNYKNNLEKKETVPSSKDELSVKQVQNKFEKLSKSDQEQDVRLGKANMRYLQKKFEKTEADGNVSVKITNTSQASSSKRYLYVIDKPKVPPKPDKASILNKVHVSKVKLRDSRSGECTNERNVILEIDNSTKYRDSSVDNREEKNEIETENEKFFCTDTSKLRFLRTKSGKLIPYESFSSIEGTSSSDDNTRLSTDTENEKQFEEVFANEDDNREISDDTIENMPSHLDNIKLASEVDGMKEMCINGKLNKEAINEQTKELDQILKDNASIETIDNKQLSIINEILETEKNYVDSLRCVVEDYMPEMFRDDVPPGLRGQRFQVFGNIEKIYEFHSKEFYVDLENSSLHAMEVARCFLKYENMFYLYGLYNKNKHISDEYMEDFGYFFERKRIELGHSLNLASQLLKPVQRLARYSLLLQKLLDKCTLGEESYRTVLQAKEMIMFQLRNGEDLIVLDCLKGCTVSVDEQGKLLRQDEFNLYDETDKKVRRSRVFLFEEMILFSTPSKTSNSEFHYTMSMKMSEVGLTDYGDAFKFIIWYRKYHFKKYTLQANSPEVKNAWVQEITRILFKQAEHYKVSKQAEMAQLGMNRQTRIPIKEIQKDDKIENTTNVQQLYPTRSLRGVPGERTLKNIVKRTTWYCDVRDEL